MVSQQPAAISTDGGQPGNGSAFLYPHKSDDYTYHIPMPPRIIVPPPAMNEHAVPDIQLNVLSAPGFDFLRHSNHSNLVKQNLTLEWPYERRRQAQRILPCLYLGPMTVAKDEAWLKEAGITLVLGVRQKYAQGSKLMCSAPRIAAQYGIEYHSVDLASNQDLIRAFPRTANLINLHLDRKFRETNAHDEGRVLVFCESGNERGAAVVAAYLMETHEDVDHVKAIQFCQAQRFCVSFDDAMKRLLQSYWDILCARRAVTTGVEGGESLPSRAKMKRGLERDGDQDSDAEMITDGTETDDVERFKGRSFAPFIDQPLC